MGRASGKHSHRQVDITPGTPEGDDIGMSARVQGAPSPIPGGHNHSGNHPSVRHKVPIPAPKPEYRGTLLHGVPADSYTTLEREELQQGLNALKTPIVPVEHLSEPVLPVPVYLVEQAGGPANFTSAAPRAFTLQASTGEPVRLCGRDPRRVTLLLLNESTSSNIRFAQRPSDLINGEGALLPWPTNSYLKLHTQDELWAISADSGTPKISIIQEFEQPW